MSPTQHCRRLDRLPPSPLPAAPKRPQIQHDLIDSCYLPIIQSGGVYELKPSAVSNDQTMHFGVIVVALGLRYKGFCSNIARTLLINSTPVRGAVGSGWGGGGRASTTPLRVPTPSTASLPAAYIGHSLQREGPSVGPACRWRCAGARRQLHHPRGVARPRAQAARARNEAERCVRRGDCVFAAAQAGAGRVPRQELGL